MASKAYYKDMESDLCAIIGLNVVIFDPLFRVGCSPDAQVEELKIVLEDILFLCRIEDDDDRVDCLINAHCLPNLSRYIKRTERQASVLAAIESMPLAVKERFDFFLIEAMKSIQTSITQVHSTILSYQFDEIQKNSVVNNIHCERQFARLDSISRLRRNLRFIHRECLVMVKSNNFWAYFDAMNSDRQTELLHKAQALQNKMQSLYRDQETEERQLCIDLNDQRLREEEHQQFRLNQRHQILLNQLAGCCPQFQANYENCLRHFRSSGQSEFTFLKLCLSLKKIELKNQKRPRTDFTVSKAGKLLSLPELRRKLFNIIP